MRSSRWLTGFAVVLVLGLVPQGSRAAVSNAGTAQQTDNGFSPTGPWNTPLPADVPLAANSQAIVNNIVQDSQQSLGLLNQLAQSSHP